MLFRSRRIACFLVFAVKLTAARRVVAAVTLLVAPFVTVPAASPVVHAQPPAKVPRVGWLTTGWRGSPEAQMALDSFRHGLREHGHVEGRNIVLEYRWAEGNVERLAPLAVELARLNLDVIVAVATPAARAARQATATIPIVAVAMGDPVGDALKKVLLPDQGAPHEVDVP